MLWRLKVSIAGRSIPVKAVGGDFFDYIADDDETKVGKAISNVSGKDLSGVMNAAMASGILQLSSKYQVELTQVMSDINVSLCEKWNRT